MSKDTSKLANYLNHFESQSPQEFEDMVAEMFRCKGWENVRITSRTADKGRDVIGYNLDGYEVYIEVKLHKNNIGRPVVQKLHSIMVTKNVKNGMIVTSSDFTPEAKEYANTVNIELINGKKFIDECNYLVKGSPRSNSLCMAIDIEGFLDKSYKIFDANIFSFPQTPSNFIQDSKFLPFRYDPCIMVTFLIDQFFQNTTGSWRWRMHFPEVTGILTIDGKVNYSLQNRFSDPKKFEQLRDINDIEQVLSKEKITLQKARPPSASVNTIKRYLQNLFTVTKRYKGLNNQYYSRICTPSLKNIEIFQISTYWELNSGLDLHISDKIRFQVKLNDNEIVGLKGLGIPTKKSRPRKVRMCQNCKDILFKGAPKKKYRVCRECGIVLCEECAISTRSLLLTHSWCRNCNEKLEKGEITKKKNKDAIKLYKGNYRNWKKNKNPIKVEFSINNN